MATQKPSARGKSSISFDVQGIVAEGQLRAENRQLRQRNAQLAAALEQVRAPARKFHLQPHTRHERGEFIRVIVPDSHGSAIDRPAAAAFLGDLQQLAPKEIILLGDHVDCGGFLAQHHVLGYVAQTDYSYADDVAAANTFLDEIQKAAPRAVIHYIEGNHERRVETWCVTQTLRHERDCELLRRAFAPEFLLHLGRRGIRYYRQSAFHINQVPGTIKLGKCYFWHGTSTAKHAASRNLEQIGGNVVYGHTHREDHAARRPVHVGDIGAWCPGCLCQSQPLWQHTRPTDWTHG